MKEEKNILVIDNYEQNILIGALYELRNRLISEDRSPDVVDDLILKTAGSEKKKIHFSERMYESR